MAVTTGGIDKAEITRCVELDGAFERPLGWSFVQFDDATESNRYVMPAANGLELVFATPYRVRKEAMRGRPFPHDLDRGAVSSTGEDSKPGPMGIHFFGNSGV